MATSIESLGLSVEVQGVESANKALKQLVDVATRAEKAVTDLEAAADSAGKKTRELDKGASGAAEATRELDKGASGAADSTKALDASAGSAAKSTGALDKGASGAAKSTEALDKGAGKADKSTKGMGDSAGKATSQVDEMGKKAATTERGVSSFASAALKAGAILAAAFSVSAIAKYADAWSETQNRLRLVTDSTEGLAAATDQVFAIAQKTSQGMDTVSQVYQRFAQNAGDLGLSQKQLAGYTETVAKAVATSGASAQSANAALIQFGQGIASGTLRGEELNSVMEQTPSLAMAIAKGLDMPIGQLKKFAGEGKLTSQVVLQALGKVSGYVDEQFSKRVMTIGQGFTNLTNSATRFVGMIDSKSGASAAFAAGLVKISSAVDKTTDFLLALGTALAPTFKSIGAALSTVGENATVVGVALAGFAAPTLIGGVASLTTAIGVGLLGAVRAVSAAMLANPIGLTVAALAAAGYAAYKFRDDINQAVGVDVVQVAKSTANVLIGSFAAAYEDIKFVWSNFGDIMGGAVIGGVNLAIRAINSLIQGSISGVNSLVEAINNIPGVAIGKIGSGAGINEMANPYAERLGASVAQRNAAVQAAMSRDYIGDIGTWMEGIGKGGAGSGSGGGTGSGGKGAGGKGGASVAIEAETAAIKRALSEQVDALKSAMEQNEYLYGLGVRAAAEYYDQKGSLERDSALAEAAAAEQEISILNKALAANKLTDDQRKKLLEDRRKLVADVSSATIKAFAAEINAEEAAARKRVSLQQDFTKAARSASDSAADQAMAMATQVEQYDMTSTAIAQVNVRRAEEEESMARTRLAIAAMGGARSEEITLIEQEIEALRLRTLALKSIADSTGKLEVLDKNKEFVEEVKKQNEQIGESLTEALMRGFEDGKGFAANFKDTMINMFKTMVLKPILQPITQAGADAVSSFFGANAAPGTVGASDGPLSMFTGGGGSSIFKMFSQGGASFGDSVVSALNSASIGSIASEGLMGDAARLIFENAETIGQVADVAGNAFAYGGAILSAINGKFGAAVGGAIGAYFGGPIGSFIGSKIGGLLDGPGRKPGVGNYGIAEIGATGVANVNDESFFYGDRRGYKGASAGLVNATQGIAGNIVGLASRYGGDATGLRVGMQTAYSPDDRGANAGTVISRDGTPVFGTAIEGTNADLEKNAALVIERSILGGLQQSNIAPQFANVLRDADITNATQEQVDAIKQQLEAVRSLNAAFDDMGHTFPQLVKTTWDAREAIVAASGGLEAFAGKLQSYYDGYYSEQERMANSLAQMEDTFHSMGIESVPATRSEFRKLVEGLDLTTIYGQQAYATLLSMAEGFGTWADYTQSITDALVEKAKTDAAKIKADLAQDAINGRDWAKSVADSAMNVLVKSINSRKNDLAEAFNKVVVGLQTSISKMESSVGILKSASTALTNTLRGMLGVIDPAMERSRAQSLIRNAANGGALPSQTDLEAALGIVATPAAQLFNSFEDYMLDFVKTANDIDRLNKLTVGQLTVEEQALATLKETLSDAQERYDDEIKYLDKQLELQQLALEEAMGNKVATLSVKDAITEMNAAIVILGSKMAQVEKPAAVSGASLSSSEQAIYNAYKSSGLNTLDAEGWAFWNAAAKNGKSIDDIVADIIKINGQKVNGSHANGLDRVPFNGYIAELHEGERVKTKAEARAEDMQRVQQVQSSGLMADSASLMVLQQIFARLGDMSAETRATAQNTGRMARLQDRWDGDGLPPTRNEMT